jgi:hypothetical protein
VTISNHSTSHKKSSTSSKSTHPTPSAAPAAPELTPAASAAPSATPATGSRSGSSSSTPIDPTAAQAIAKLDALEASLDLDIVVPPNDKAQMRALSRVSDKALALAADIVSSDPSRFADFSAISPAVQHVETMVPVGARVAQLATHVQKSIQNKRTPAAQQTLALYAVVKGLGRITGNETMREKVPQLKAELAPKRTNPKPKVTKMEKAAKRLSTSRQKKLAKAMAVLADLGVTPPAATPAAPATPSAPPAQPQAAPVAPATPTSAAPSAPPAPAAH